MKTVKDKYLVVGADFAGYPLKEAVVSHLRAKGWKIEDLGVREDSDPDDTDLMFHRVGLRVGAMISEGVYERALLFCGTGMGIHIAASKCPHVHAGVVGKRPGGAAGHYGERGQRPGHGSLLCGSGHGLRHRRCLSERRIGQRV